MEQLHFQQVYEELEVMRNYMDSLFQQIQNNCSILLLPSSDEPSRKLLPGVQDEIQIKIMECKDVIVVSAEMNPGLLKRDITIELIHPMALRITYLHRKCKTEDKIEYAMCKESFGYLSQIILLPAYVFSDEINTSLKNGILNIHLKKRDINPEC